ncbi:unnamed protein product, partial [Ectocarpus sp. 8 AP-2014]
MRRVAMPLRRQREAKLGGGAAAAAGPQQAYPMDLNTVKGILREFDRAAYGEAFRGDRLAKIAFLGRGSTSAVWKVVDIETLRVVAVKEMIVCDSKQGTILRHELSVLHPQLQPLVPPKPKRLSGRRSKVSAAPVGDAASSGTNTPTTATAAAAAAASTSARRSGKKSLGGGKGVAAAAAAAPVVRPGPCPYMPRYYGSFVSHDDGGRPRVSIVMEYVSGVDLARWIEEVGGSSGDGERRREGGGGALADPAGQPPEAGISPPPLPPRPPIPDMWLSRVCRDMLEALRYLHERGFIHRDVKPANVLLGPGGARLVDFGSTIDDREDECGGPMHGTVRFMSPERLCARPYRPSSDLWAAGLTVASAALGENPVPHSATKFEAAGHAEVAFEMVRSHPASAGLSPSLLDFLRAVLVADPERRPTVEQMLAHPFV